MSFSRNAFCNHKALEVVACLARGESIPPELRENEPDALAVRQGINNGWFVLPKGKNGAYSKAQFRQVRSWLSNFDVLKVVRAAANELEHNISALCPLPLFEVFGNYLNGRLPCPFGQAANLDWSCPRLPFDFEAGKFGVSEYCDVVEDLHGKAEDLLTYIAVLKHPGFLSPGTPLEEQAELLRKHSLLNLLPMVVRSIHKIYLGRDGERQIKEVVYGTSSVEAFTEFLSQRKADEEEQTRVTWAANYRKISSIASVLAEARTYHQASLTRLLRTKLHTQYRVIRVADLGIDTFALQTDEYLPLGCNTKLLSPFELVNWIIALDEATKDSTLDVYGFWAAVNSANFKIERMRLEYSA